PGRFINIITKPAPAIPPANPTIIAQRFGAGNRHCCSATKATTEPSTKLEHPVKKLETSKPSRTKRRIQPAPPKHARQNALSVLNCPSVRKGLGCFIEQILTPRQSQGFRLGMTEDLFSLAIVSRPVRMGSFMTGVRKVLATFLGTSLLAASLGTAVASQVVV